MRVCRRGDDGSMARRVGGGAFYTFSRELKKRAFKGFRGKDLQWVFLYIFIIF